MKKVTGIVLGLLVAVSSYASAMDFQIFDMRNKIFEESKAIKVKLAHSQDAVVLINLFDSCLITMSQLDAYFSMLGIFDTIKKEDLSSAAINYIIVWLNEITRANASNIKNFKAIAPQVGEDTNAHIAKVTKLLETLNTIIVAENNKLNIILRALQTKAKK